MGWIDRSYARFHREMVLIPQQEARRYENRWGAVEGYRDVHEYDRGRMSAAEQDSSPDGLAHHYARAERTPPCVRSGECRLNDHVKHCPLVDLQ